MSAFCGSGLLLEYGLGESRVKGEEVLQDDIIMAG